MIQNDKIINIKIRAVENALKAKNVKYNIVFADVDGNINIGYNNPEDNDNQKRGEEVLKTYNVDMGEIRRYYYDIYGATVEELAVTCFKVLSELYPTHPLISGLQDKRETVKRMFPDTKAFEEFEKEQKL